MTPVLYTSENIPARTDKSDLLEMPQKTECSAFKICIPNPFPSCEKVAPRQQKKTAAFIEAVKDDENVRSIMVFGSSVTEHCRLESDLDLYVKLEEDKQIILPAFSFPFDLWTNFMVDERLYREIQRKGVIVYERNIP